MKKFLRRFLSFLIGCAIGVVLHYTIYRMSLPIEPFIYVGF
jgi:hypothetical protein